MKMIEQSIERIVTLVRLTKQEASAISIYQCQHHSAYITRNLANNWTELVHYNSTKLLLNIK